MNAKELYQKIYDRFAREGFLKALFIGVDVGFSVMALTAFVAWFLSFNGIWLALIVGIAVTAGMTALLYFTIFKPTKKSIAKRLDRMGFEERFITMIEFEGEEDYIYRRQYQDAEMILKRISRRKIKIKIPVASIVAASVVFAVGASMTTVEALSENGVIDSGSKVIDRVVDPLTPDDYVSVSYFVEEGGYIEGESDQVFKKGGDATTVIAVEDDGWVFKCWTDEAGNELSDDPVRTDLEVEEDTVYIAVFQEGSGGGEGEGEGDPNGEPQEGEDGQPQDSPKTEEQQKSESSENQDNSQSKDPNNGAGPGIDQANNNIQGDVYYRDVYEDYRESEMDGDMTDEDRDAASDYFDAIK